MSYTTIDTASVERPEDATHFCPETDNDWACWYKKTEDGDWAYMYADKKATEMHVGEWMFNSEVDSHTIEHMIEL